MISSILKNKETRNLTIFFVVFAIFGIIHSVFYGFGIRTFANYNLLFYVLPPIYLLSQKPKLVRPVLLFTIAFSLFLGIILNHFARVNNVWAAFPKPNMLNYFYAEDLIWMFLWILFTISIYSFFFHPKVPEKITRGMRNFTLVLVLMTVTYIILVFAFPFLRQKWTDYAYLKMTVATIPSLIYLYYKQKHNFKKLLKFGAISFVLSLIIEIIGKRHQLWQFNGEYIGWINLFGATFPVEELVLWMVVAGISLAGYYEIFLEEKK